MSKFDEYLEAVRSVVEAKEYIPQENDYKIEKDKNGLEYIDNQKMKIIKNKGFYYGSQTIDRIKEEMKKSKPRIQTMQKYKWLQKFHPDKLA